MEQNSSATSVVVNGLEIDKKSIYISEDDVTYLSPKRQSLVEEMQKWLIMDPKKVHYQMGKIIFTSRKGGSIR